MASDRCNYLKNEWRNNIYKTFQNSSKNLAEYNTLQQAISEVSDLIYEKKNDYYNAVAKKLSDPKTSSKTYWSILKTFYNTKKVPIIPPILIENKLETDFLKKANYFNTFFASKCTPLSIVVPYEVLKDLLLKNY